jgi:signal peptidase I
MAAPTHAPGGVDQPDELFADDDLDLEEPSTGRTIVEWTLVVAGAVLAAFVIKTFVLQAFFIPSASMEPTLRGGDGLPGDRVLVDKVSYRVREPSRGDVIVFEAPADFHEPGITDLIKRVVGVPGDEIVFEGDRVRVNGQFTPEPYLRPGTPTQPAPPGEGRYNHRCIPEDPCRVPPGHLWVMGDNRTDSEDSRYMGPVSQDLVVGRAFVLVWPLDRISGL